VPELLEQAAEGLRVTGTDVMTFECDVTDYAAWQRAVRVVVGHFLSDLPDQLNGVAVGGVARRLSTHAILRLFQGAARFEALDTYFAPAGSDIALLATTVDRLAYTGIAQLLLFPDETAETRFGHSGAAARNRVRFGSSHAKLAFGYFNIVV